MGQNSAWALFNRTPKPSRIVGFSVFRFGVGFQFWEVRCSASASVSVANRAEHPRNRSWTRNENPPGPVIRPTRPRPLRSALSHSHLSSPPLGLGPRHRTTRRRNWNPSRRDSLRSDPLLSSPGGPAKSRDWATPSDPLLTPLRSHPLANARDWRRLGDSVGRWISSQARAQTSRVAAVAWRRSGLGRTRGSPRRRLGDSWTAEPSISGCKNRAVLQCKLYCSSFWF